MRKLHVKYDRRGLMAKTKFFKFKLWVPNAPLCTKKPTTKQNRPCRDEFEKNIRKIETDAQRAALFCVENHHKYLLGHMIVFRMHLNKSQDYVQRCQKINRSCGTPCETTPRMIRWRRLALLEINRVKDDIQHSRRSYKDLLVHSRRKLKHLRQEAELRTKSAIVAVEQCVKNTTC